MLFQYWACVADYDKKNFNIDFQRTKGGYIYSEK